MYVRIYLYTCLYMYRLCMLCVFQMADSSAFHAKQNSLVEKLQQQVRVLSTELDISQQVSFSIAMIRPYMSHFRVPGLIHVCHDSLPWLISTWKSELVRSTQRSMTRNRSRLPVPPESPSRFRNQNLEIFLILLESRIHDSLVRMILLSFFQIILWYKSNLFYSLLLGPKSTDGSY